MTSQLEDPEPQQIDLRKLSNSDRNVMGSSCLTLTTQQFDNDCSRSELARMIVMHDYPLSMVEHEGFRDFCLSLQSLFKHVCRKTISGDILRMYEEEKAKLFHKRCAAHILNLIVKSGLDVIDCGVEKIRDSVAFWMATPKRMEKFEETAKQLNLDYGKRDVLAIPISTVASESSFSTRGRIVSSHRNRHLPSTLEGNVVNGVGDMLVDEENDMTEGSDVVDG
ncbi:hypothetical protein EZV62_019071 [Acer yangbiense]|uniref:HAT C-terminal dimerisation domain-containing protein n=1 Tax=Acer yangbiense TaxID=1000413 RepID=A0A5C7HB95_9ROSI|nr:hypothetical protein EZV62_019071 [Acer yangbiense]